jgi:hypothetical protein
VGFKVLSPLECGVEAADFCARMEEGGFRNQIVGVVCLRPEDVSHGFRALMEAKAHLGEEAEYVVALQPMPDSLLLDVFKADDGKLYSDFQAEKVMVWVCFPRERGLSCFLGQSKDGKLGESFRIRGLVGDHVLRVQLSQVLFEEE